MRTPILSLLSTALVVLAANAASGESPLLTLDQAVRTTLENNRTLTGANARKTAKDLERNRTLFEKGDVSDAEMEGLRLAAQNAESALRSAEVALKVAQRQLADTQVRSPIAGTVDRRFVEVGETVGMGTSVADVVDLDVVKVRLTIPEQEIGRVTVGQTARVTMDPYPGVIFEGQVVSAGSKAEENSHRYPVEVEVANRVETPLKSGMFARTEILTTTQQPRCSGRWRRSGIDSRRMRRPRPCPRSGSRTSRSSASR